MGKLKSAFDSVLYAIAILSLLFFAGLTLGIMPKLGQLFSLCGAIAIFFLVFTLIAK